MSYICPREYRLQNRRHGTVKQDSFLDSAIVHQMSNVCLDDTMIPFDTESLPKKENIWMQKVFITHHEFQERLVLKFVIVDHE